MSKDNEITNEVWDFYMKAAPQPEVGEKFYTQQFPVRNLNAVFDLVQDLKNKINKDSEPESK